ncbi:circadian clock KaiB family protein [Flavobacterium wongokense]|uniref:circadian clock KaiB family protein n=1 Tax=Flavobacterium wongokense TaxID=2910674 RepID=UPI001F2AA06F|nr:circadian clock KaiB family protein [Flavobacterium sp. WG47]MCF6131685.1 circadian clock KaiB family protein [Flavobacterium sp. WG47]
MKKETNPGTINKEKLSLQLYVSGMSPKSLEAIRNINRICAEHLKDAYDLEIIDIYKQPELATEHSVIFSPSLIKHYPLPKKILIGTLKDCDKVMMALGIDIDKTK